ncbi:MAG: M20/M25/M40 family metallo-hydrolase [Oscillospiraceae bacterium]|nr:M20/M25/M40 family metallo-hydrolase [Oscillospiraceae bacterium]
MGFLYIIPAALIVFIAVLVIRAVRFTPPAETPSQPETVSFDKEASVDALAQLIRCRTVSYDDHSLEDDAEFEKLIALLPGLYPNVMKTCLLTRMEDRALLFKWKGRGDGDPAVLMAHYDVVPVDEAKWERDPFGAEIIDGVMWGRGTLDTKGTFNGILSAAENLIKQGFVPENDIYFAFSGGEEVNGKCAVHIVDWFKGQGIDPAMVLDEGGAVVENVFPGVKRPCAVIGIAEKGMMNLEYSVASGGGHASAPAPHTPVGKLSAACVRVEDHPFKFHLTKPVELMFNTLGRHSTFLYRLIFANLWCFKGVLDLICKSGGGELNALVRTTVAFTQMSGSKAPNVIPPTASMVSNSRLNPCDSVESAMAYVKKTVNDPDVTVTLRDHMEPSPISRTDCEGWERVKNAVADTWQGSIVTPYLMMQCSDSRHYGGLSDKVYRFSAMDLTKEERGTIHGNNERVRVEVIHRSVEFFIRVMKQC